MKSAEGICGVDVNEKSVDLCVLKLGQEPIHIMIDTSKLAAIAHSMQLKQKSIDQKFGATPQRPIQKRRLTRKYERRRWNRTKQILHIVTNQIIAILVGRKVEPVFEDLTNIRQSMRSKHNSENGKALNKTMRRRLNHWPFRKLQSYIEYKVQREGYNAHYLPQDQVRGTSSTCPICGTNSKPKGYIFTCKACGYTGNRHFVGAYNIAARWWTTQNKNVGSHVPPEWRQMQPQAEAVVLPRKPKVKAQRSFVQFSTEI